MANEKILFRFISDSKDKRYTHIEEDKLKPRQATQKDIDSISNLLGKSYHLETFHKNNISINDKPYGIIWNFKHNHLFGDTRKPTLICEGVTDTITLLDSNLPEYSVTFRRNKTDKMRLLEYTKNIFILDRDDTPENLKEVLSVNADTGFLFDVLYWRPPAEYKDISEFKNRDIERFSLMIEGIETDATTLDLIGTNTQNKLSSWADMQTENISWLWNSWIPNGFCTLLVSESGLGKSAIALQIAKSIIDGSAFPDGTTPAVNGSVLWIESEAAQQLNRSRAESWCIDLNRLNTPFEDVYKDFNFNEESHKKAVFNVATHEDIKLIILDSLSGSNTKIKENDAEMMNMVKFFAEIAKRTGKPVILTHHLNKGDKDNRSVNLSRVRGSSAIVQLCRSVIAIDTPDILDKEKKRLSVIKSNLAKFPVPLGFCFEDEQMIWSDAPRPAIKLSQSDKAEMLLSDLLKNDAVLQSRIEKECEQAGISFATMKNVKQKLNVTSFQVFDNGKRQWLWKLDKNYRIEDNVN